MTNPNIARPPKLYITPELVNEARDEHIRGIIPNGPNIKEVVARGSQGVLRGVPIRQLILHSSADVSGSGLTVFRVNEYAPEAGLLEVTDQPGIHPKDLIARGLPEIHTLVVPIKDFDELAAAWALHRAAGEYGQTLDSSAPGAQELRAPTELFGVTGLDVALRTGLSLLGGIISRAQPPERRETPEALADQLEKGIGPIIGRGVDAISAVQGLPAQPPLKPMEPDEMDRFVQQTPPLAFPRTN
jgi:hypothetical protein